MKNTNLTRAIQASGHKRSWIVQTLGISRASLYQYEQGREFPASVGLKLQDILGVPMVKLMSPHSNIHHVRLSSNHHIEN